MAITYVGGRGAGRAGTTSTVNVAINSGLTGGSGATALAGDLVVVTVSVGTQARQPNLTPSGYTPLTANRTTATTYDTNVQTSYKFMPDPPDTVVTIPATGNIADGQGYVIQVFRGVDPATPMDVTPTYLTGSGANNRPDPAAITPATAGAWILCCGGGAAATGTTLYTATYLTNFLTFNGADTNDGTVGAGYYTGWTSGSYNPAVFGGGSVNAANSWGATTIALRPEAGARTADLSVTLAGAVLAAASTVVIAAALSIQLAGATLSSGATAPVVAALNVQLAGATLSATAGSPVQGGGSRCAGLGGGAII